MQADPAPTRHTMTLHYSVTGSTKRVALTQAEPTADDVTRAFETAVGGPDTMWHTYYEMPVPSAGVASPLSVNASMTQVSSVNRFFSWCTQASAFQTGVSVFVAGRETPLMPHEAVPVDGGAAVTLLPETTVPELTDGIRRLCLEALPVVIERKLAIEQQRRAVRRLASSDAEAAAAARAELARRKAQLRDERLPSFVASLVNGAIVRQSSEIGAAAVVERLRRFFLLLVREAKHCVARAQEARVDRYVVLKQAHEP